MRADHSADLSADVLCIHLLVIRHHVIVIRHHVIVIRHHVLLLKLKATQKRPRLRSIKRPRRRNPRMSSYQHSSYMPGEGRTSFIHARKLYLMYLINIHT